MAELLELKDWKALVEAHMGKAAYSEPDILRIKYLCEDYLAEIQPIFQWLGQQQGFVTQMHTIVTQMYFTMFGKQPPPRSTQVPTKEVLLDTPDRRKQVIRETALSLTKPGDEVTDEAVLEDLRRRGMKIEAPNPTAAISTILNGFKSHFRKVQGKRGVFKREQGL